MPRLVRVTDWGTHGWYTSVCDKCGAEVGMSASLYTREMAENTRCFICEPAPEGMVTFEPDPADDFATDSDLRAIDDNYDRERTLAEMAWWKACQKAARP